MFCAPNKTAQCDSQDEANVSNQSCSAMALQGWITSDESAKEMLARVLTERPCLLLPPLHRVPLRAGNVVEIVGPSSSAKSEILIQAAISCILPKKWNGVHYGGLERLVMYFDLDCRFDSLRLSQSLKNRIMEACGPSTGICLAPNPSPQKCDDMIAPPSCFNELYEACLKRFLYIRCYNSFEFLAALKTIHYQLRKKSEAHGVGVHFLLIDSINAFYWIDRASKPFALGGDSRKNLSLQTVTDTVVHELRKLLQVHPMLVLATKATILGTGALTSETKRTFRKSSPFAPDSNTSRVQPEKNSYCEYMPSVWQLFVTHRILLQISDESFFSREQGCLPIFISQWLLPSLNYLDKFTVTDAGIFIVT